MNLTLPHPGHTSLHSAAGTRWGAWTGCLQVALSTHSQGGWPVSTKVKGAELSHKLFALSPTRQDALRELILGIKMLSAWWGIRLQEITVLKNYVLCARHYVPPMLGTYNTHIGQTQLHKPVSTDERHGSAQHVTSAVSVLTAAGDITLPSFSL